MVVGVVSGGALWVGKGVLWFGRERDLLLGKKWGTESVFVKENKVLLRKLSVLSMVQGVGSRAGVHGQLSR